MDNIGLNSGGSSGRNSPLSEDSGITSERATRERLVNAIRELEGQTAAIEQETAAFNREIANLNPQLARENKERKGALQGLPHSEQIAILERQLEDARRDERQARQEVFVSALKVVGWIALFVVFSRKDTA